MINNDNKKSAGLWVKRLYEHSGISLRITQGKTYFAHRYSDDHTVPERTPFSDFFSGLGCLDSKLEPKQADFQGFFRNEPALSEGKQQISETGLTCDPSALITPDDGLNPANNASFCAQFTVLNCYDETPDTKTFRLGKTDGQKFDYLPGQYITLSIVISGQLYKRSYSLASSPSHPEVIEITIKRDPNGGVAKALRISSVARF